MASRWCRDPVVLLGHRVVCAELGGIMRPRLKKERVAGKASEREIQEACCDFLALDGWRRVRTDIPKLRGMGVQEKGMADDLFLRPTFHPKSDYAPGMPIPEQALGQMFWCEWKQPKGKASAAQLAWHASERARGALTIVAGCDFEASIEGFCTWYAASGLARRVRA